MPIGSTTSIPSEVKFLPWTAILKLPVPWPRCQEISHLHEKPVPGDNIVVISQAWSYQLHPDPTGSSVATICALLKKAAMILRTGGRMLVFCDYLCIPQLRSGTQSPQSSLLAHEQHTVLKVIEYMPHLSFDADAVIHVCHDAEVTPEDTYTVSIETLKNSCVLHQLGDVVQVQELHRESSPLRMYDQVLAINGHGISSMDDLPEEVRTGKPGACSSVCQTVFPSVASYFWSPTALMTRAPFGYRIRVPADEQGHIYFSHFISMVKVAMMEEASAQEVIFASDPQVKVDILRGGSRLRRATQEGLDALAAELQNFTQELEKKTFLPVSSDTGRMHHVGLHHSAQVPTPLTDYEMVSHLMQVFVEELAIGVSLPLWRAVREDNLEECRHLLQDHADPNLADGKGTTAMHIAAEARSMEVLKLLLERGASSTAKDHRGRTPAHCLALNVDPKTVELVEIFMEDSSSLHVKNKAGVSVFERFYLWSLSALDGDPFEPLCSRLRHYAGSHFLPGLPELWHLGVQSLGSACPRSLDSVTDQTRRLNINGTSRIVHVLVPVHIQKEPLLYFGFGRILPWSLQEPALKMLAYEQCCEIFCIGCEAVLPNLLEEDSDEPEHEGEAFYNDLFHLIDVLPLTYRFYVLDSSYGLALPVLWKLWDRLSGVLTINPSWIFNPNTPNDMLQHFYNRAEMLSEVATNRDVKKLSNMLCDFSIAPSLAKAYFSDPHSDDVGVAELMDTAMHRQYEAALTTASEAFWKMGELQPRWAVRKLTRVLRQLPPWQPPRSIYVILACGSHSPLAAVQNAAYNLQELLPGSMQVYLPHCSWLWHIEGTNPVIETNELLGFLREDGTATASLTSMLVRKRRDLESGRTSPTRRVSRVGFQLDDGDGTLPRSLTE